MTIHALDERAFLEALASLDAPPSEFEVRLEASMRLMTSHGPITLRPGTYRVPWRPWVISDDFVSFVLDPSDPETYDALSAQGAFEN
jgi:hypothetical protein